MRCGFHASLLLRKKLLFPYAWVGNYETQCPGQCVLSFHQPIYGPQMIPLVAPNKDMGIDEMIINITTILTGVGTNPFNTDYFQGDAAAPLEVMSTFPRIYGKGVYLGFPGKYWWMKRWGKATMPIELMGDNFYYRLCMDKWMHDIDTNELQ
jgi:hypothetical protein